MPVTSAQVRMARAALNWTVRDLAEATKLHRNTITNIIESRTGRYAGDTSTLGAIETVLKRAGIEFIDENGGGLACGCANAPRRGPNAVPGNWSANAGDSRAFREHAKIAMGGDLLVCDGVTRE